jgi:hypothetical protein
MSENSQTDPSNVDRLGLLAGEEIADGELDLVRASETLLVQIVDVVLHCDELQPVFIRDDDADGNASIFDDLFLHKKYSLRAQAAQTWRIDCLNPIRGRTSHSTARAGEYARAVMAKHGPPKDRSDDDRVQHVTSLVGVALVWAPTAEPAIWYVIIYKLSRE